MCCFSGRVREVRGTRIFARALEGSRQALVYDMSLAVDEPVAMVLPIPTPPGSPERSVRFLDLSREATFFEELDWMFKMAVERARGARVAAAGPMLRVHRVGRFVASFIPARKDFARLDPRFRLPRGVLAAMDEQRDWGFVVFQLAADGADRRRVHPMAFEFPRRRDDALFFPTLHVHDGRLHATARFDHRLYWQRPPAEGRARRGREHSLAAPWMRVPGDPTLTPDGGVFGKLFDPRLDTFRARIAGRRRNRDLWVRDAVVAG